MSDQSESTTTVPELGCDALLSFCSYCQKPVNFFQAGEAIINDIHVLCCGDCFPKMQEHAKDNGWDGESIGEQVIIPTFKVSPPYKPPATT